MAQEHGFDEGDDGFLVRVEVLDGLEVGGEVVGGAAFVGIKDELIRSPSWQRLSTGAR